MKAQFVYENLDFERGRDPKQTMGIGQISKLSDDNYLETIRKDLDSFLGYKATNYNPGYKGIHFDFVSLLNWIPSSKIIEVSTRYYNYNDDPSLPPGSNRDRIPSDLGQKIKSFFINIGIPIKRIKQVNAAKSYNHRLFKAEL